MERPLPIRPWRILWLYAAAFVLSTVLGPWALKADWHEHNIDWRDETPVKVCPRGTDLRDGIPEVCHLAADLQDL